MVEILVTVLVVGSWVGAVVCGAKQGAAEAREGRR
jgi:hypothetical protein